jgi:hypothetical protein
MRVPQFPQKSKSGDAAAFDVERDEAASGGKDALALGRDMRRDPDIESGRLRGLYHRQKMRHKETILADEKQQLLHDDALQRMNAT